MWESFAFQTAAVWNHGRAKHLWHKRLVSFQLFSLDRASADFRYESDDFSNGFSTKKKIPTKADLYSNEEMQKILEIHTDLSSRVSGFAIASANKNVDVLEEFGLHDVVLQTLGEIKEESTQKEAKSKLRFDSRFQLADFQRILPNIKAIASDVDGTLLSSQHTLPPATKDAVRRAVEASYSPMTTLQYFFPATGKTRAGALRSFSVVF
jgi:hypothetical protein